MRREIEANLDELVNQASMTTSDYMVAAIECIDSRFHDGYAQSHPELIAGFIKSAAIDFQTAMICKVLENIAVEYFERMI